MSFKLARYVDFKPFANLTKEGYSVNFNARADWTVAHFGRWWVGMPDLHKLFEKAEKLLQKQRPDAALEAFQEIYKAEPNNEEVLLNIADLSLTLNRRVDALRFYGLLTDHYIRCNDPLRAMTTLKKILKVSPHDVAAQTKLAGLLEKAQKKAEAIEAYRAALAMQRRAGAARAVMECLQHIVQLEPTSLEAQAELGEAAAAARQPQVAAAAFLQAARIAREAGAEDRWAELAERAHTLDPSNEPATVAFAELLIKKGRAAQAVSLLEPSARARPEDLELLGLLGRAFLDAGEVDKAKPLCWKVFQARPEMLGLMQGLLAGYLRAGNTEQALSVAMELKSNLVGRGKKNEYLSIVEKIYALDESNVAVLEMLTELYNEMNKEDPLRRSLTRLFNLCLATEDYSKAADTLEKILDGDPYGVGHQDRLLNLEGHIDPMWYKNIAQRLEPLAAPRPGATPGPEAVAASMDAALEDLMVEAEMYFQYQLPAKCKETLEKINQLFPGVERRNKRLQQLYDNAGFTPKPSKSPEETSPAGPAALTPQQTGASSSQTVDDLARISSVTSHVFRESTAQGVMQVAVREICRAIGASRCWGSLGTAGGPPTLTAEYCDPSTQPGDTQAYLRVYSAFIRQASTQPDGWLIDDARYSSALSSVSGEMESLGIQSLLAFPLMDKENLGGLLLVEQCDKQRSWLPRDTFVLKAIAPQVVVAVNNTKLRRLVRSLAGTDPETGLLPRASYVDCLLAEASRAKEQSKAVSVCLLEPVEAVALAKSLGESGTQAYFQQVSKILTSCMRQNDFAIRYSPCTIAVVFPDTALPQGALAVEKLRRFVSDVRPDEMDPPGFCGAVCDLHVGAGFDAVDAATEVINRLQAALEAARQQEGNAIVISRFEK